ncbi:hypothetical protein DPEC_G00161760 [Dallia pectoralis]|uniref:Uncharacterized protein n=1 Tax=Dallia pectoralis TaxID=75939 RepID=A0ACC2GGX5_DALPE|nr:hypothetical protein DPEC_G00161760 [Dallia pectoralis]
MQNVYQHLSFPEESAERRGDGERQNIFICGYEGPPIRATLIWPCCEAPRADEVLENKEMKARPIVLPSMYTGRLRLGRQRKE